MATQIELHRRFGGVFPEVASRQHVLSIEPVIAQALAEAGVNHPSELDAVAVTHGPGLAGSLSVGVNAAKGLAFAGGLPLLPVNHLEGHVYSNWLDTGAVGPTARAGDRFPVLVLIVSGGHTELVLMPAHGRYTRLGGTLDDAAGEAFDKVARLLDLGFPGGPAVERAAQGGDPRATRFRAGCAMPPTIVMTSASPGSRQPSCISPRNWRPKASTCTPRRYWPFLAASFQQAVVDVLVDKTAAAAQAYAVQQVCICGGVSANACLRTTAERRFADLKIPFSIPPFAYCTDNAAMIGAAAFYRWREEPGLGATYR